MKLTIDEAKARLRLPELCRLLNMPGEIPERDGQLARCIWPERHKHGDARKSFNFHQGLTRYRCFGCGAAGDGPDLISETQGIPPEEALKKFLALAGDEHGELSPATGARVHRAEPPSLADEWGDSDEKRTKRKAWPCLLCGTDSALAAVALLRALKPETMRDAQSMGWLRFCELAQSKAWVLRSQCGRIAQARKLDGAMWRRGEHEFKSWSLPGSCAAVPLGWETVTNDTHVVGIAEGGPDFLAIYQTIMEQNREDCGLLGFLGASVRIAAPVVERLRGRRVRVFAHADEAGRRAAAEWSLQLTDAGCECDAFDFAAFGVKDCNDFAALPLEQRDVEVMPL